MRFDPSKWSEISVGQSYPHTGQRVHVRSSLPVSVYVTDRHGQQALAGTGVEVNVLAVGCAEVKVTAHDPKIAPRVFLYDPSSEIVPLTGASLTNTDRQPHESGMVAAVLHRVKLAEKAMVQRMRTREQQAQAKAERRAAKARPDIEVEPAPPEAVASEPQPSEKPAAPAE